jgi:hypothetical protein
MVHGEPALIPRAPFPKGVDIVKKNISSASLFLGVVVLALGAAGCGATRYAYRPAAMNASTEAGFPASRYVVPPDAPQGEAFVTSFGTRDIDPNARSGAQLVHVRLAVANETGAGPWTLDPGKLLLIPPGGAPQRPDFMEIDGRQNGSTEIARGQRRVLDLYYRLPGGIPDASRLPSFDFSWQVGLGGSVFSEHTPFVREPYEDYERSSRSYVAVGVAPPWWWGWYGSPWWGPYGWSYGYGPYIGFGYHGYHGGPRYYGGGGHYSHFGRGGGGHVGPTVRGRMH